MKCTCVSIWGGHMLQRDHLASVETRISKKSFQRLCPEPLDGSIPSSFHSSQYPEQPGQMKQSARHLPTGSSAKLNPGDVFKGFQRALWAKSTTRKCWSLFACLLGLLWETVVWEPQGWEQDSCCKLFVKTPLPSAGPGSSQPRQSVQEQKNKDCCPPKSMAGGKILGHRVPAKTCHFLFLLGETLGTGCESEWGGGPEELLLEHLACDRWELVNSWKEGRALLVLTLALRFSSGPWEGALATYCNPLSSPQNAHVNWISSQCQAQC